MANDLKSWVTVKANDDTLKYVDSLVTKAEERIENDNWIVTGKHNLYFFNI